jgi:hypothetical protein
MGGIAHFPPSHGYTTDLNRIFDRECGGVPFDAYVTPFSIYTT